MVKNFVPGVEYDFDPRKLPDDVLAAIGLVTACAAQTESVVEMAIAGCLGLDTEYGGALTTHMTAPLRDGVLRAVAEIRIDDLDALDQLDELLDDIKTAQAKRNSLVHNIMCTDPKGTLYLHAQSARTSFQIELVPIDAPGIIEDALIIYDAGMALMKFLVERGLLPPLPPTGRARTHKLKAARKKRRKDLKA